MLEALVLEELAVLVGGIFEWVKSPNCTMYTVQCSGTVYFPCPVFVTWGRSQGALGQGAAGRGVLQEGTVQQTAEIEGVQCTVYSVQCTVLVRNVTYSAMPSLVPVSHSSLQGLGHGPVECRV